MKKNNFKQLKVVQKKIKKYFFSLIIKIDSKINLNYHVHLPKGTLLFYIYQKLLFINILKAVDYLLDTLF